MLLFVTEKFPWPVDDGGQIRTYQVLASLARRFPTTLIALAPPHASDEEPLRALGIEVVTFAKHRPAWKRPWYALQALFTKRPYPLAKNFSNEMLAEIRSRVAAGSVRALHFNHIDAAQYLRCLEELGDLGAQKRITTTFDTHNLLTNVYQRLYEESRQTLYMAYCWTQWHKMQRYERDLMKSFDRVLVCSKLEQGELRVWGVDRTLVVPNGVDTKFFTPAPAGPNATAGLHLVFTGAMAYLPNADGLRWFLGAIWPLIEERFPDVRLTVVGKDPPRDLVDWTEPGRIEFTGRVDDVRPFARSADLIIVPLQVGGGTRLKILEALAMELPVVSTPVGAEGLELEDGVHLLLGETEEEFAARIIELANDRPRARALAQAGRARVLERYDWSAATAPLVDEIVKAIG